MEIKTGTYTGDAGTDRGITGVGFEPVVVFVMNDTDENHEVATDSMASGHSCGFGGDDHTDGITSLDADGFTLGDGGTVQNGVNENGANYYYVAFGDGGGTDIATGTYSGDGNDDRSITGSGFNPDMVFVISTNTAFEPCYRTGGYPAGESSHVNKTGFRTNEIQAFVIDGFELGGSNEVNYNGATYYYITWLADDTYADYGGYTGDGNDDRDISTAFDPTFVVTDGDDASIYNHCNHADIGGEPSYWWMNGQDKNDCIQELSTGGGNYFQVGTHDYANKNTILFEYFIFKDGTTAGGGQHYEHSSGGDLVAEGGAAIAAAYAVAAGGEIVASGDAQVAAHYAALSGGDVLLDGGATLLVHYVNASGGDLLIQGGAELAAHYGLSSGGLLIIEGGRRLVGFVPPLQLLELQRQSVHLADLRRQGVRLSDLRRQSIDADLD